MVTTLKQKMYILIRYNSIFSPRRQKGWTTYKSRFELHYLRVDYQANHWLNANNAQMDVGTANDTGGWKLAIGSGSVVVDTLFNVLLPLFVGTLCFVLVL